MSLMAKFNQIDIDSAQYIFTSENFIQTKLVRQWLSSVDEAALLRPRAWRQTPNFLLTSEQDTTEASISELTRLNEQRCSLASLQADQNESKTYEVSLQNEVDHTPMHFDVTRATRSEPLNIHMLPGAVWHWVPTQLPTTINNLLHTA